MTAHDFRPMGAAPYMQQCCECGITRTAQAEEPDAFCPGARGEAVIFASHLDPQTLIVALASSIMAKCRKDGSSVEQATEDAWRGLCMAVAVGVSTHKLIDRLEIERGRTPPKL